MNERVARILGYERIREQLADCTISQRGRALALALVPKTTQKAVLRLRDETKEAESMTLSLPSLPLTGFDDIVQEAARLRAGANLNCAELLRVSRLLAAARRAKKAIVQDEEGIYRLLPERADGLFYDDMAIHSIQNAIASEEEVSDNASSELRSIRRRMQAEHASIRDKLNAIVRGKESARYLQEALITMRDGRFVVPVKAEYRSQIKGIVHGESASGATLFIEPMSVVESNNKLRGLEDEERREIERILAALSDMVRPFEEDLRYDAEILAYLDLVFAKAALAIKQKAFPPEFNAEGVIHISKGRHPLIAANVVIPVSLELDAAHGAMIITGPNTGGKTVTLKLIGLFAMMAQSGLFLPAEQGTSLPVFEQVFADIGDEQSIEQSLSTFSAHMKNIIYIAKKAKENALVLLDELCAGTDPEEGACLAMAILSALRSRGAKLFITTHYSELKAFAMTADGFVNASMEFDVQSLMPTYRLIMGVAGASNALLIARRLGLSPEIVDEARGFMRDERLQFDHLLIEAERARRRAQKELKKAQEMQRNARALDEQARQREAELEQKAQAALERAQREAYEIVREARDQTEEIIQEVKKLQKQGTSEAETTRTVQKARGKLTAKRESLEPHVHKRKEPARPVQAQELHMGDGVHVTSMDADATVLTLPDAKGMLTVQAGILKLNVHVSDLSPLQKQAKAKPTRTSRVNLVRPSVSTSINLHGYTVEEALLELDQYLDDAFLAGLTEVWVIHGKGTGALRSGVQSYLRRHPHVAGFRLGKYGEGETGVTVVTLK